MYNLINKIYTKFTTWNSKIIKLTQRFYSSSTITSHVTYPSGFSQQAAPIFKQMGGSLYVYISTTKSSNWSTGNITNTACANFSVSFEDFRGVHTLQTGGMGRGGIKSIFSGYISETAGDESYTQTRSVQVNAVATADTSAQWAQPMPIIYMNVL